MRLNLENLQNLIQSKKVQRIIVFVGLAVILLIFLSTLSFDGGGKEQSDVTSLEDTSAIEKELEQRLEQLLEQIDGVASVKVMVTLDCTSQRVYARDSKSGDSSQTGSGGSNSSSSSETSLVLAGSGNSKEPIEQGTILPRVRGVAVVCEGAEDPLVKEKVVNAVISALNVGASRVYVTY